LQVGRLSDAAEYARAALRNYETYGQAAAAEIQKTQQLLARIEQALNSPPAPSLKKRGAWSWVGGSWKI